MTFKRLISKAGFWCCLLGVGGIGGALDFGSGWITSITLLVSGIICLGLYIKII